MENGSPITVASDAIVSCATRIINQKSHLENLRDQIHGTRPRDEGEGKDYASKVPLDDALIILTRSVSELEGVVAELCNQPNVASGIGPMTEIEGRKY